MRLSAIFEPRRPPPTLLAQQQDELGPDSVPPAGDDPAVAPQLPDDLDQRVRQIGEWQLEDW
jgi:hypothetical protein